MMARNFTRSGSGSLAGSRFVLAILLALGVIFGMLAMHSLHLTVSLPTSSASSHSTTADPLATQVAAPQLGIISGYAEQSNPAGMSCANCSPGELSMAVNCLLAVVLLGIFLLLPRSSRIGGMLPRLRAGPQRLTSGLAFERTPSIHVLCINRC